MTFVEPIDARPMSRRDVAAARKLLAVIEAGATAMETWPTYDCDTPERTEPTALEKSYAHLKDAMTSLSMAMYELT